MTVVPFPERPAEDQAEPCELIDKFIDRRIGDLLAKALDLPEGSPEQERLEDLAGVLLAGEVVRLGLWP